MELIYSDEIVYDLSEMYGHNRCSTLRVHRDHDKRELQGIVRAQTDWSTLVSPLDGYKGGMGNRFSFIRVTVPECLPQRLEIISYANEFAFLYDDSMEEMDLKTVAPPGAGNTFLDTFGKRVLENDVDPHVRPEKRIQARMLSEMLDNIDGPRAITAMKSWARFVQLASQTRTSIITNLAEYIPARVIDAGELIWFGTLTFAMAITVPPEEIEVCMDLARPGYIVLGLVNDLFSWRKERADAKRLGQGYVFNAIWVLMMEHGVDEDTAKKYCIREIQKYAAEFEVIVERTRVNVSYSRDLRVYIEAVMHSCRGNWAWSAHCPRYHDI